ncbi:hypothetical protein HID58_073856 [Brassica napus]|uniref:Uncharacterized protein n=1 Tax=Brassica napus TaxID=3708 RepID=A0ABQ7YGH9_BRANA|nr:hypothetical protein HID58_073856 [Brassica napus]
MISRRWDPDWVGAENQQDHKQDDWKRGFHSFHLRIDLGIDKGILGRLRKLKIGFEWSLIPIIIKTESWLHEGSIYDYNLCMRLFSFPEIRGYNQRFDSIGEWCLWYCGILRLKSINFWRSGFIGEYFMREDLDNWGQYIGLLLSAYQAPSVTHMEAREEGEIKITEED